MREPKLKQVNIPGHTAKEPWLRTHTLRENTFLYSPLHCTSCSPPGFRERPFQGRPCHTTTPPHWYLSNCPLNGVDLPGPIREWWRWDDSLTAHQASWQVGTGYFLCSRGDADTQIDAVGVEPGGTAHHNESGQNPALPVVEQKACPPATTVFTELPGMALTWDCSVWKHNP